jgi:hypothetical protein
MRFKMPTVEYVNYIATMILLMGASMLYNKYKYKLETNEPKQFEYIKKYLLHDSSLANSKNPLLWIHVDHTTNCRVWDNFGSRNTNDFNQPYQYLSVASIINNCGESFNIVLFDDNTFNKIIPGWSHDMSSLPDPIKGYFRQLAIAKLLHSYGGMVVPSSYICFHDMIDLYESHIQMRGMFVGEFVNRNITSQTNDIQFFPNTHLMACEKDNKSMLNLIRYIELMISQDYTNECDFEGKIETKCLEMLGNREISLVDGLFIGTKDANGKPVILDELLGNTFITFNKNKCNGVYLPADEIIKRTKYNWFAQLSSEEVLTSNTVAGKLLLTNAFTKAV